MKNNLMEEFLDYWKHSQEIQIGRAEERFPQLFKTEFHLYTYQDSLDLETIRILSKFNYSFKFIFIHEVGDILNEEASTPVNIELVKEYKIFSPKELNKIFRDLSKYCKENNIDTTSFLSPKIKTSYKKEYIFR